MRRAANIFIVAFLAVQVLLPLRYYLSADRYDERFAWRMFSPMRMVRCGLEMRTGPAGAVVPLGRTFHEAWLKLAERARGPVVDAMAARLCARPGGAPVRAVIRCQHIDQRIEELSDGSRDLCAPDGRP